MEQEQKISPNRKFIDKTIEIAASMAERNPDVASVMAGVGMALSTLELVDSRTTLLDTKLDLISAKQELIKGYTSLINDKLELIIDILGKREDA